MRVWCACICTFAHSVYRHHLYRVEDPHEARRLHTEWSTVTEGFFYMQKMTFLEEKRKKTDRQAGR